MLLISTALPAFKVSVVANESVAVGLRKAFTGTGPEQVGWLAAVQIRPGCERAFGYLFFRLYHFVIGRKKGFLHHLL